jgi:TRAP transporter TAXI family solute receptor
MQRTALLTAFAVFAWTALAAAQSVGIGTSNPGSIYHSSGTAIAKVANQKEGLQATIQPFASPNVFLPAVDSGELQFGFANIYEGTIAYQGKEYFSGRPHENLRAVAVVYPIRGALFVKKDSNIRTIADLKGHPMPDGYTSQKTILRILDAIYATAGLTRGDMEGFQVPNVVAGANAFTAGKIDGFMFAMGAAKVREADAAVGGIRALPVEDTPESLAAMQAIFPGSYFRLEKPSPANPGVTEPVNTMAYDALLYASAKASDETVYKMTKAMYENKADLAATFPVFKVFDPQGMAKNIAVPYHPGSIKFYTEKGLWPPK